jgi:peptidyl-prolyl cis-trans isomerase SurA
MTMTVTRQFTAAAFCAILLLGAEGFGADAARAQAIAVFVNGEAITTFDVDQRMIIAAKIEHKAVSRAQALNDCIDDKLKAQEAHRIGYRISEDDVDQQYNKYAQNMHQTVSQFDENLKRAGIQPKELRNKTRAEIAWITIIQQRMKRGSTITNTEVDQATQQAAKTKKVFEYKIQQVVFVVPTGGNVATIQRRQKEAAAAKGLFKGCDNNGFDGFRSLPDVAVRDPVNRSSEALSEAAQAMLNKTPVGSLAGPIATDQGVELIAVCDRKERSDLQAIRGTVETDMVNKKTLAEADQLMKELRSKAVIERHR